MRLFDIGGGPPAFAGATRWLVHWTTHRHKCDESCEDRFIGECFEGNDRAFRSREKALVFAQHASAHLDVSGAATLVQEVFEPIDRECGSWEQIGKLIEVEPEDLETRS